ncbi:MAG: serine protease, subtilase family, partial [Bryobacterales bacterium]|nr:serine protease, subtilase family [Bryobacterales bacterium]
FAAAMNNSSSAPSYPAACNNVLGISATEPDDTLASFSNYGNWIKLSAPGDSIMTTEKGGGYWSCWGTSFATPIAAAVGALALSANPSLTAAALVSILEKNSDDLGTPGFDNYYGYGRVNAYKAVAAAKGMIADTTPPAVSISSPASNATVSGAVSVQGTASDNVGVTKVEFYVDGSLYSTGASSPFSFSWNTSASTNGSHTLSVKASDAAGNTKSSSVSVNLNNPDTTPPTVSITSPLPAVTVSGTLLVTGTASDNRGVTKIEFYVDGSLSLTATFSPFSFSWNTATLVNGSHTVTVKAYDAAGNNRSASVTDTVSNTTGTQPLLQIHADASEVTGVTNGSVVTPGTAPAGFTGKVVVKGTGTVNFAPARTGNGVYFLNCCTNTNNAYYKFTGTAVGNVFKTSQGQITFYLKSRYSFAQRTTNAASKRYAFDVRDGNGKDLFFFLTQVTSGYLQFNYSIDGVAQYYYVPKGTEDALFGSGVVLKVSLTWAGSAMKLYLNGALVKSSAYTAATPNWTSASVFDLGAYEYSTYGGYYTSDDVIDEFSVN